MSNVIALHGAKSRQFYADKIGNAIGKSVEGFIEAGRWLTVAKEDLRHGEFEAMAREDLNMSPQTARKLMSIAEHPVISNRAHVRDLPPSWGTLYELTKVGNRELEAAISDGRINPKMERKDVALLAPKKAASGSKKPPREDDAARKALQSEAGRKVLDEGMSLEQAAAAMGLPSVQGVKLGIAREEGRREALRDLGTTPPPAVVKTEVKSEATGALLAQATLAQVMDRLVELVKPQGKPPKPSYQERAKIFCDLLERTHTAAMDVSSEDERRAKARGDLQGLSITGKGKHK